MEETDYIAVTNNFLYSLFSECSLILKRTTITQATDLYHYRSYLETLLTYVSDAANSHLTNGFWYLDTGDLLPSDPTKAESRNTGFIARWTLVKKARKCNCSAGYIAISATLFRICSRESSYRLNSLNANGLFIL